MRSVRLNIDEPARRRAETQVCEKLRRFIESNAVTTFALYAAMRAELSLETLGQELGTCDPSWVLAFPRVVDETNLAFHRISEPSQLRLGAFGILEPTCDSPQMLPGSLDMIVVPGLAFDREGARLGWGRGYYDRALSQWPSAVRVGIAFSNQVVDRLPRSAWDIDVDFLITEKQLVRCPGAERDRSILPEEMTRL